MDVTHIVMPGTASFEDVRGEIDRLARLWNVHGIMVEQPLPEHLKPFRLDIWRTIRPHKVTPPSLPPSLPSSLPRLYVYVSSLCQSI